MNKTQSVEFSPFDSDLLKKRTGKVAIARLSTALLTELTAEADSLKLDILLIKVFDHDYRSTLDLEWSRDKFNLKLADLKVKLTTSLNEVAPAPSQTSDYQITSTVEPSFKPGLEEIIDAIALRSRFALCFNPEVGIQVYRAWLQNSLSGAIAQNFLVAIDSSSRKPAALVTTKIDGTHSAELSLVGVHPDHQGRGVGRILIAETFSTLRKQGIEACTVITQLENRSALRLYNSIGFKFDSMITDFHLVRKA